MRFNKQYNRSSGSQMRIGPGSISPVIKYLMIVNLFVFALQILWSSLAHQLGLWPGRFFTEFPNLLYQPMTYMFLHGGFGHIFFNMFGLWMFGTEIEYTWGSRKFLKFYILGGLSGAVLELIFATSGVVIGASAAIYAVLIAYWVMFPNRLLYLYFLFPLKVKWAIPGFMILGLIAGGANIAHLAHVGGAVFGFIYMKSDWRFISFGQKFKNLRYKRQEAKLEKNRQKAEDVMKKVDDILDRINEVGIDKISKAERKILEDASSKLSDKNMSE